MINNERHEDFHFPNYESCSRVHLQISERYINSIITKHNSVYILYYSFFLNNTVYFIVAIITEWD